MSRKSRRGIKNTSKPRRNVNNATNDKFSDRLLISFHNSKWMDSTIKRGFFCNGYKDEKSMIITFRHVFYDIFPYIENNYKEIINGKRHCHIIRDKERKKVFKVIKCIYGNKVGEDADIYQMTDGVSSIRVFGILIKDRCAIFYPLFIDPYHEIYPSRKHNGEDIKNYHVMLQNIKKGS